MSYVLIRLLREATCIDWDNITIVYENENKSLPVPAENSTDTLHTFNVKLDELFTRVYYDFARARRNKDAIERYIENVMKDYYNGPNELARKAAGIQFARNYPAPADSSWPHETVDLFELEDRFRYYYHSINATIEILRFKAEGKITNNSLLKLDKELVV